MANPLWSALTVFFQQPSSYVHDTLTLISTAELGEKTVLPNFLNEQIGANYQATTGKFFSANYPTGTSFVYSQMGQTPWYAGEGKVFTDTLGLTSRNIGYLSFHKKASRSVLLGFYDAFFSRMLILFSMMEHPFLQRGDNAIDVFLDAAPDIMVIHRFGLMNKYSVGFRLANNKRFKERYRAKYLVNRFVMVYEHVGLERKIPLQVPYGAKVKKF